MTAYGWGLEGSKTRCSPNGLRHRFPARRCPVGFASGAVGQARQDRGERTFCEVLPLAGSRSAISEQRSRRGVGRLKQAIRFVVATDSHRSGCGHPANDCSRAGRPAVLDPYAQCATMRSSMPHHLATPSRELRIALGHRHVASASAGMACSLPLHSPNCVLEAASAATGNLSPHCLLGRGYDRAPSTNENYVEIDLPCTARASS